MKPCTEVRKCSIRVTEEYIFYEILHVDYMHRARALASLFVCLVVRLWTASLRFVQKNNKVEIVFTPNIISCDFKAEGSSERPKLFWQEMQAIYLLFRPCPVLSTQCQGGNFSALITVQQ